jgi:dihydroflavonol-4-reductase
MRAFVTGATGFLGGRLVERLRERGAHEAAGRGSDEVVCLVRSPDKAARLRELGCEIVEGDLSSVDAIRGAMEGCDAAFHLAADYRVGVHDSVLAKMRDANAGGTERVLDAARDAGVAKVVYVSTMAAFGNTRGRVVDETYEHPGQSFTSKYERTKWEAHKVAVEKAREGVPVVIVQPGSIYGEGDPSATGTIFKQAATGKLPAVSFPKMGLTMVHVDDVVDGCLLAYEKGQVGESYALGGETTTMRGAVEAAARAAGRKPPRFNTPTPLIKAMLPIAKPATRAMGLPPNLRELISSSDGVTFWASDAKARRDLGYAPRDMETGFAQTFGAHRGAA